MVGDENQSATVSTELRSESTTHNATASTRTRPFRRSTSSWTGSPGWGSGVAGTAGTPAVTVSVGFMEIAERRVSRVGAMARVRQSGALRGFCRRRSAAAAADQEIDDADHDPRGDGVVEVVQGILPILPVVTGRLADPREHQDPGDAAGEGEGAEAPERHPGDAGRERYEGAD